MPQPLVAGLDLGGTKILARALDPADPHGVVAECRVDTPRGTEALVAAMAGAVTALDDTLRAAGREPVAAVGVGAAGQVDLDGVVRFAPNLPGVVDADLAGRLAGVLERPVSIDNDANCALWAEVCLGAAVGVPDAALVTLGTGIGGGLVLDGRLRRGATGFAGEPGHMIVDPHGPPCPCGRRGCWERFASGSGLGRLGREAAEAGRADAVRALAGGVADDVRGEHVTRAARDGDPGARAVMAEFAWWVGLGVANLADLFDPTLVIVGGGLAAEADLFLDEAARVANELVIASGHRPPLRVVAAALGAEAGVLGAALLAADLVSGAGTGGG